MKSGYEEARQLKVPCIVCTLHSALCTLHSALCTLHSALCTMHSALCTMHYAIHQAAMSDPQTNCHWISRRPLGPLGPLKVDKRAPTLSQVGPFVKSVRAGTKVEIVTNANNKMNSWCSCLNLIFPVVFVFVGDLLSLKTLSAYTPLHVTSMELHRSFFSLDWRCVQISCDNCIAVLKMKNQTPTLPVCLDFLALERQGPFEIEPLC